MGTRLAINKHAMLPDGRMFVESRGEFFFFFFTSGGKGRK